MTEKRVSAATPYYAVVYQFGKVASTSIVATLNDIPSVTAVQSHFLGEEALAAIIPTITGAEVSQYFFQHQLGQFIHNTRITRHINRIRAGRSKERLLVISLARHPMEWIRSSIVQDMAGYLDPLKAYAARQNLGGDSEGAVVSAALTHLIGAAADLIAAEGGIDATIDALQTRGFKVFAQTPFEGDPGAQRLFRMMLRPFDWFDRHYRTALGLGLEQMTRTDAGLEYKDQTGFFFITRYETIAESLASYVSLIGLADEFVLKKENTSEEKLYAAETSAVFKSPEAGRFADQSAASKYSQAFGYT